MQKFISKFAVAAHLALAMVSPLFLFPFGAQPGTVATVMAWLTLPAAMWVVMEPSRHAEEMLHDARVRLAHSIVVDPLFWCFVALFVFALVRFCNDGVGMAYDAENLVWTLKPQMWPVMPGVVSGHGAVEMMSVVTACVVVMGCRHALGKTARLFFISAASFFAALAAIVAIVAGLYEMPAVVAAVTPAFTKPDFVGVGFGVFALCAIPAIPGAFESKWNKFVFIHVLSLGICSAACVIFSPSETIALFGIAAIVMILVSFAWAVGRLGSVKSLKCFFSYVGAGVVAVLLYVALVPDQVRVDRFAPFLGAGFFRDSFFEARAALSTIAAKAWKEHPWIGSGLGSFQLDIRFLATPENWKAIWINQQLPMSAWWYIIAERGITGAVTLALPLGMMTFTFIRRLFRLFNKSFFLPGVVLGLVAIAVAVAESFMDVSFLRPELLVAIPALFAISANSLPPLK